MISAPRLPIAPSPSLFMIPIAPSLCWICNPLVVLDLQSSTISVLSDLQSDSK